VEAIVVASRGRSHRAAADPDLIRWGDSFARIDARIVPDGTGAAGARAASGGDSMVEVVIAREGPAAGRKRVKVNGVPRRSTALAGWLRIVVFAPEEMLLVVGSPSLRRGAVDLLASERSPAYGRAMSTYVRALSQRNSLLKAVRDGTATRDQLRFWDETLLESGSEVVAGRLALLDDLAEPLRRAGREIAPEEGTLGLRYLTNAAAGPGETPRDAFARRLAETAEKELWQGTTLVGPHRDDLAFLLDDREMATSASRGQQRTAILALKLAELDLLTAQDGRPPLLLLDDVFSELDPARRAHLVRRIAELPQAFVTTTTLADIDAELRAIGAPWRVDAAAGPDGSARLVPSADPA
jgi:DNA replication and repair protein RecF